MSYGRSALYLQIPAHYCRSFGGLRWAQYGEAIEFLEGPAAGRTFAFAAEVAAFLEGLENSDGSLPGFGFVLHLLYLIGLGDRAARHGEGTAVCVERIAAPFRALGCPLRNAGALCSWLSREAPRAADPPELAEIHEILTGGSWVPQMVLSHPLLGVMDQAEEPALEAAELEALVRRAADSLSDGEIRHWLRHGCGAGGNEVEPTMPPRPRGLAETLAELERSPRLAGIGRLVSRLEGAISLPPRRLAWSELQDGGYSDITTKGAPEQILPIQFALEEEEFLRRFAERELLYFYREEPRQPTTEEIIVVLDQGARTWGEVRLVLASAAVALARQAQRRRIAIKLAVTSNDGMPVDPAQLEPRALGDLLEASDLTDHPGAALARLRDRPSALRRDIVLLTHPRSLAAPDVVAAARALAEDGVTRLFAVSVDSKGQLELAELRRGLPVVLARGRIDLAAAELPPAPPPDRTDRAILMVWKGNFESIGFPFYTGALDQLESNRHQTFSSYDFDDAGERIMIVGRHGRLFCCRTDGSETENLPRPRAGDEVVTMRQNVVGVAGGFVLEGRCTDRRLLVHYDFPARTCTLHEIHDRRGEFTWLYYRDLHVIVGLVANRERTGVAFDLGETGTRAVMSSRASRAIGRVDSGITPYPLSASPVWTSPTVYGLAFPAGQSLKLDGISGTLHFRQGTGDDVSLTPRSDGRPVLLGGEIIRALQGGDILGVLVAKVTGPAVYFISVSRAAVIGTFPLADRPAGTAFALARDGRRFARPIDSRRLEVRDVPGDLPPLLVTPHEELWIHFATLGKSCLLVREFAYGGPRHALFSWLVRWDQGWLDPTVHQPNSLLDQPGGVVAVSRSLPAGNHGVWYDSERFVQIIEHGCLRVLIDRYNHLVVLGRGGELVCMMFVSRHEFAAWLPDGTMLGPRRLLGGGPTPGASERIAAALLRAEQGGGTAS